MAFTIQNQTTGAAVYAATSSVVHTSATTATNGNCEIKRTYNNNEGTITALEFLPDEKGNKYENSFCIRVRWDNGGGSERYEWQSVLFGHNPSSTNTVGAKWEYYSSGSWHTLGVNQVSVTPTAIRVSAVTGDSGASNSPITDLTFAGYWVSGKGYADEIIDGNFNNTVGSHHNPVKWHYGLEPDPGEYKHYLSWKRPSISADNDILYYVVAIWKGYKSNGELGGLSIVSSTSFIYPSSWYIGPTYDIRYTVHAIYAIGAPSPSFNQSPATVSEHNNDSSSTASYAIWRNGGDGGKTIKLLQFYETSDRSKGGSEWTLLTDTTGTPYSAPYVVGAPILAPPEIKINGVDRSEDYRIAGWLRSSSSWNSTYDRPSSWTTTQDEADENGRLIAMPNYNFAYKQVLRSWERTLIMDYNDGTGTQESREVSVGEPYGIFPQVSRLGYELVGWFTAASGGTQVYPTTLMSDGTTAVTIYAQWKEHWDTEIDDLVFLHYEKPAVNIAVKRDSLENPEGIRLWVKPILHPILDKNNKDKNFVADITDINWRPENRSTQGFRESNNNKLFDSRIYYNWQTAETEDDIIKNIDGVVPAFDTGILMDKVRTNSSAKQKDFDLDTEYQFRCLLRDALQSYYNREDPAYGDDYPYKTEGYSSWGQYLQMPSTWSTSGTSNFQKKLKSKSSGISDASNDGKGALLLKYVTKLLVHNPFIDQALKESRELEVVNDRPVWNKQLLDETSDLETDFWQIREHSQNSAESKTAEKFMNSLLDLRSQAPTEASGGSVNGFTETEVRNYLIPTLVRALRNHESLVYDPSQVTPLINMLFKINDQHSKISKEHTELLDQKNYSGLDVDDMDFAALLDAASKNGRILELDGERHQTDTSWETEPDSLENRVLDTDYQDVELGNFQNQQDEDDAQSTIDHITNYDMSQLDLKTSLSDLLYILSRMTPREAGSEGAKADFNDPSKDSTNMSNYWDSTNNRFKDSAFTNWIPSTGKWRTPENDLAEYGNPIEDYALLMNTDSLDPGNTYGENDFANNGCRATCMGLCTSGCYNTCVGGCKTACGDSCFFGCKNDCKTSCGGDCTSTCKTSCTSNCGNNCTGTCTKSCTGCGTDCSGACEATCKRDCNADCKNHCKSTCTGNCGNACSGSCQNGCKASCSGSCNTTCTANCKDSCGGGCDKSCGGGCSNSCKSKCSKTCTGGCQGGCYTSCTTGCGNGCGSNCGTICSSGCTRDCSSACDGTCQASCYNNCGGSCMGSCKDGCILSCGESCGTSCKGGCGTGCASSCTGACKGSCKSECSTNCGGSCSSACDQSCSATCNRACSSYCSLVCSLTCKGFCKGSCENNCGALCQTYCDGGCRTACQSICGASCSSICIAGCKITCTSDCEASCEDSCGTNCQSKCSSSCSLTCGSGCKLTCSTSCSGGCGTGCSSSCVGTCVAYCQVSCDKNCETACNYGCKTACTKTCATSCELNCIGKCSATCKSSCNANCGNACGSTCGSSCSGDCNNKCKSSCNADCTSSCAKDCNTACKTTCNSNCTSGCSGNCSTTCGSGCNSSCKGDCKSKCYNTCGAGCTGACKNSCEATCTYGCVNGCKSNCQAACKGACQAGCGNSCTGSCAGTCQGSCIGSCSGECGLGCADRCETSCNNTCFDSCHTSCTGSAYKLSA